MVKQCSADLFYVCGSKTMADGDTGGTGRTAALTVEFWSYQWPASIGFAAKTKHDFYRWK
jgi:hypothetical protein